MTYKHLFPLVLLLLSFQVTYAQEDFRSGFIIKSNSDTLHGFINYRANNKNAKQCRFKASENSEILTFQPTSLIGYKIKDDKFLKSLPISNENNESEFFFLEELVQGNLSLYMLNDNRFFLKRDDEDLKELKIEKTSDFVNNVRVNKYSKTHIGILNYYMADCSSTQIKSSDYALNEKKLTKLIEKYNGCISHDYVSHKELKPWFNLQVGPTVGISFSNLKIKSKTDSYKPREFQSHITPTYGLSFLFQFPRLSERLSFQTDLLHQQYRYTSEEYKIFTGYVYREEKFEADLFKIPLSINYKIANLKYSPFINVGVIYLHHYKGSSSNPRMPSRKSHAGLFGSFGFTKEISTDYLGFAEIRIEKNDGVFGGYFDPFPTITSRIIDFQLLVGVRIK